MGADTGERLERALAEPDVWQALGALVADPPPDLVEAVEERYERTGAEQRRLLTWLLQSQGTGAGPALPCAAPQEANSDCLYWISCSPSRTR